MDPWITVSTVMTAVATSVYAIFAYGQWRATANIAEQTERTIRLANRARVGVKEIRYAGRPVIAELINGGTIDAIIDVQCAAVKIEKDATWPNNLEQKTVTVRAGATETFRVPADPAEHSGGHEVFLRLAPRDAFGCLTPFDYRAIWNAGVQAFQLRDAAGTATAEAPPAAPDQSQADQGSGR